MRNLGAYLGAAVVMLFVCWVVAYIGIGVYAHAQCLSKGWARADVAVTLQAYCQREENEFEITTPLSELE